MTLAGISVLAVVGLIAYGWTLHPEQFSRWVYVIFFLPALWGFLELMQSGNLDREKKAVMNWHRSVIAWFGLVIAVRVAVQLALSTDLLEADWAPLGKRIQMVIFGLGLAIWGNYLPKLLSPWNREDEPFDWQQVHRFAGWVASLGGIGLLIVWLTFPLDVAGPATRSITIVVAVLGIGRKLISLAAYSRRQPPPTPQQEVS